MSYTESSLTALIRLALAEIIVVSYSTYKLVTLEILS
jgi:hypothetical protein